MQALLAIIALIGVWVLVVRFGKKRGWRGWVRHLLGGLAGLLVCGALAPAPESPPVTPPPEVAAIGPESAEPAQSVPAAIQANKADEKTLGITLEQYAANFNAIGAKLKPTLEAYVGEVQEGPVNDVANIKIDDNRMLMVTLKRGTKTVTEVTLIGQGDGTPASGVYLFLTAVVAAQAAVPESERAVLGPVIGRLLQRVEIDKDAVDEMVGSNKVWMNRSSITGFMAGISPAENT